MNEIDDILTNLLNRQTKAEEAINNRDLIPEKEMWSTKDLSGLQRHKHCRQRKN